MTFNGLKVRLWPSGAELVSSLNNHLNDKTLTPLNCKNIFTKFGLGKQVINLFYCAADEIFFILGDSENIWILISVCLFVFFFFPNTSLYTETDGLVTWTYHNTRGPQTGASANWIYDPASMLEYHFVMSSQHRSPTTNHHSGSHQARSPLVCFSITQVLNYWVP